MRLDPTKVRFISPSLEWNFASTGLRFIGKENNINLLQTALTVEGNMLKVGFLGIESIFRYALAEWSSITIPYSRIEQARYVRFPRSRQIALFLLILSILIPTILVFGFDESMAGPAFVLGIFAFLIFTYIVIRTPGRYVILFRDRDKRRRRIFFRFLSKPLRIEFDEKLQAYRQAATRYAKNDSQGEHPHE